MRVFTTLTLTHSDGYVVYNTGEADVEGSDHGHAWYDFWDADLGQTVGAKAQLYEDQEGLFIREFTNGWAVYNRSGTRNSRSNSQRAQQAFQVVSKPTRTPSQI
jgi:hypothetical protein